MALEWRPPLVQTVMENADQCASQRMTGCFHVVVTMPPFSFEDTPQRIVVSMCCHVRLGFLALQRACCQNFYSGVWSISCLFVLQPYDEVKTNMRRQKNSVVLAKTLVMVMVRVAHASCNFLQPKTVSLGAVSSYPASPSARKHTTPSEEPHNR